MKTTSLAQLRALNPCAAITLAGVVLPDQPFTIIEARAAGLSFEDIIWGIAAIARTDDGINRLLQCWLDDCHTHAVSTVGTAYPPPQREHDASARQRDFAEGRLDAAARAQTRAAGRVAWAKAGSAAIAAARAGAIGHGEQPGAAIKAATEQATMAWNSARDLAKADETRWQHGRLVEWFSEPEPAPLQPRP